MLLDAERVASGTAAPKYTRADYERAMLRLAASEGGDPTVAYAWLLATRDPRMAALYLAARMADLWAGGAKDQLLPWFFIAKIAESSRLEAETARDALKRLIETDATVRDGYRLACREEAKHQ